MLRGCGTYTTYQGTAWRVSGRTDRPDVLLYDDSGATAVTKSVAADHVGTIEKVKTTASWRGAHIFVGDVVTPGTVGFYTDDAVLAERENLPGDRYSGWRGIIRVSDLEDTSEHVLVLREAGSGKLEPDPPGSRGGRGPERVLAQGSTGPTSQPSGLIGCRIASVPPSTYRQLPTISDAASERRNAIGAAISSALPSRPMAVG